MQTVVINTQDVACYGLTPSRHPLVYLPLDHAEQTVTCPYCSIFYIHENATQNDENKETQTE